MVTFSQCGEEYYSNHYVYPFFVTASGDTINKLNAAKRYEGLHVVFDDNNYVIGDGHSYTIGYYKNGLPDGKWKLYCPDGSFSTGEYNGIAMNAEGDTIDYGLFIYQRIGVWQFFDKDSNLVKTERYDRIQNKNRWRNRIYRMNNAGKFILIKDASNVWHSSRFNKQKQKDYYEDGSRKDVRINTFFRRVNYSYYENGRLSSKAKCRTYLGIKTNTQIQKFYSKEGKMNDRMKYPCKTSTDCRVPPMPNLRR